MEMIKELKKANATELYVMVMDFWNRNKIVKDKQGNLFTVLKDNQYLTQEEAKSHNEYFKQIGKFTLLSSQGYTYNLTTGYKNYGRDNNFGYLTISYQGKTTTMNNLVYKTFIQDIPEGYVVHHLSHNPYNNNISNLAMITRGENLAERFKYNKNLGKEMAKKHNKNYIYDRNSKTLFKNKASVAQYVKGLIAGVTACLDGRFKNYKGLDLIQLSDQQQEKATSFNFFEKGTKMVNISQITL